MKPDPKFVGLPKSFWAHVRLISEKYGYTRRGTGQIKVASVPGMVTTLKSLGLNTSQIADKANNPTKLGQQLHDYFTVRADILNNKVEPALMNVTDAKAMYERLLAKHKPTCPLPMNKQKGEKKSPAYLTCMINILVEAYSDGLGCDYDPRSLTSISLEGTPFRTLARRVDGAFPSTVNPIAVWEIKEYYYTVTFGSRVADGVYESLLDGMELEEIRDSENIDVKHYLMIDAHYTWWDCGRSYLCRIFDMVHMGYVDEVIVGREIETRLPELVKEWMKLLKARPSSAPAKPRLF